MAISISLRAERFTAMRGVRVIAAGMGVLAIVVAGLAVSRSALLSVRRIEVTGTAHLSEARVIARAHLDEPANALWLDERAIERRLERHAWIGDARVSVALPSTVRIAVVERTPVAVADGRFGEVYVAADGTALGRADDGTTLPTIEAGVDRRTAAGALAAMPADLRAAVRSVAIVGGSLQVRLDEGPTVIYGSGDRLAAKGLALERILEWARANAEELGAVDLTAPAAPAVQLV